jgi:hypothetical protein
VILLVIALVARVDRITLVLAVALLVVTMVQPELAAARHDAPIVAAFHPVNALLIAFLAWTLARRATELARSTDGAIALAPSEAASAD